MMTVIKPNPELRSKKLDLMKDLYDVFVKHEATVEFLCEELTFDAKFEGEDKEFTLVDGLELSAYGLEHQMRIVYDKLCQEAMEFHERHYYQGADCETGMYVKGYLDVQRERPGRTDYFLVPDRTTPGRLVKPETLMIREEIEW